MDNIAEYNFRGSDALVSNAQHEAAFEIATTNLLAAKTKSEFALHLSNIGTILHRMSHKSNHDIVRTCMSLSLHIEPEQPSTKYILAESLHVNGLQGLANKFSPHRADASLPLAQQYDRSGVLSRWVKPGVVTDNLDDLKLCDFQKIGKGFIYADTTLEQALLSPTIMKNPKFEKIIYQTFRKYFDVSDSVTRNVSKMIDDIDKYLNKPTLTFLAWNIQATRSTHSINAKVSER